MIEEELALIRKKPGKENKKCKEIVGMAIPGGGLRSAYFGLGALQALIEAGKLDEIDYLSTSSGGSYIGASLTWLSHLKKPFEGKNINFIRHHCSPLFSRMNLFDAIALGLRCAFLGAIVYLPLLALILHLTYHPWYLYGAAATFALLALSSIVYSFVTYFRNERGKRISTLDYRMRAFFLQFQGALLSITIALAIFWTIGPLSEWLSSFQWGVATASTAMGYIGIVWNKIQKYLLNVLVATTLCVYGILLFAFMLAEAEPQLIWGLAGVSLILGYFVNINLIGIYRVYRDRLMEIFLPDPKAIEKDQCGPANMANAIPLSKIHEGPYHIYCCSVLLGNSKVPRYAGRGADSFILSPLYCGSSATGWQRTDKYMNNTMNPATAMAISAAAFSAGLDKPFEKTGRYPTLAFLMTLFNVKMAYWAPNPKYAKEFKPRPNYFFPGLISLLSMGRKESSPLLELADGAGFDNMGIYELIRRKVGVIIVTDASIQANHPPFGDLGRAIEHVRADFGVTISFDDLTPILPGTGTPGPGTYQTAKQPYLIGKILYPDRAPGVILYVQTVMTADLPTDVGTYKNFDSTFPNDATPNQFYTESAFEAYRQMGYCHMKTLLNNVDDQFHAKL